MWLRFVLIFSVLFTAIASPQVQLGETLVLGATSQLIPAVETFKGIPYARPPLERLRFQPPVLQKSLNATEFNATMSGPACLQQSLPPNANDMTACSSISTVPRTKGRISYPCLCGSMEGIPIMAVALNYRLGQLGFPQGEEAQSRNALNLGLKDQLTALEWVQANIENFGGDKDQVTVAGESAGGRSVDIHTRGGSLQKLARNVIVQSSYNQPTQLPSEGNDDWAAFVKPIPECASTANTSNTFSCMQQVNTSSLLSALTAGDYFQPVVDELGGILPDYQSQLGIASPLPLLIGTNLDEGTLDSAPRNFNSTEEIRAFIIDACSPSPRGIDALAEAVDKLIQLYPSDPSSGSPYSTGNETFGLGDVWKQFASIWGDFRIQSHARAFATKSSEEYNNPTYVYEFADHNAVLPAQFFPEYNVSVLGVAHTSELFFLSYFGPLQLWGIIAPEAVALSQQMQDYWLSFITSLNPNDGKGSQRPEWAAYSASGSPNFLQLDGKNLTLVPLTFREQQIDFLNQDPVLFRK